MFGQGIHWLTLVVVVGRLGLAALGVRCLHEGQVSTHDDNPLDPASWYSAPDVCGSCIAWRPTGVDQEAQVASGVCKLRPELSTVPATMAKCTIYKPRGQFRYSADQVSSPKRRRNKVLKEVFLFRTLSIIMYLILGISPQIVRIL